jgi:hypothetical protein
MLVTERMQALGDHAKSSRQPTVKERKYAKADESAAEQDVIDEIVLETGTVHESAAAVIVDDAASQIAMHENGNGAVGEITSDQDPAEIATAASVTVEIEPQPVAGNDSAAQAKAVQEDDDISAAKRAIIHEWENWSALHSDELDDPNVAEYFYRHLEQKRPAVLNFSSEDKRALVLKCLE